MRLMAVGSIDGYVKIGEIGEIDNEPRRIHGPSGV